MKKVIRGRLYDTEKATEIGYDSYSNRRDFSYWCETLYRKRTGEFFLYGEGGPASKYSVCCGQNEWSGGEKIIPLSFEEAQKWTEEHLDADTYMKYFKLSDNVHDKETVSIRLSAAAIDKLKIMASKKDSSASEIIEQLIMKSDLK